MMSPPVGDVQELRIRRSTRVILRPYYFKHIELQLHQMRLRGVSIVFAICYVIHGVEPWMRRVAII